MAACVVTQFSCHRGCPQSPVTVAGCLRSKSETEGLESGPVLLFCLTWSSGNGENADAVVMGDKKLRLCLGIYLPLSHQKCGWSKTAGAACKQFLVRHILGFVVPVDWIKVFILWPPEWFTEHYRDPQWLLSAVCKSFVSFFFFFCRSVWPCFVSLSLF
jgi:hypothetical protein